VSFRRREPLHQRLAREGGLLSSGAQGDTRAPWDKAGIHGVHRPREWDEVVTVEAEVDGDEAHFVVLEDEIVIEEGPDDVEALVQPVNTPPPYRAEAQRAGPLLWTVGVRRISVMTLAGREGETLEFVSREGFEELTVDGARVFGSIPELAGEGDYVVRGQRIVDSLWEIERAPL
jgi:hypothetical protein